jgi:hypothetical protein
MTIAVQLEKPQSAHLQDERGGGYWERANQSCLTVIATAVHALVAVICFSGSSIVEWEGRRGGQEERDEGEGEGCEQGEVHLDVVR